MKLKNSYILLIVIAIFLLVSMGSVCANDDVSDVALADDGLDAVLADSTGSTPEPKDTEIISEDVKVKDTADKKINLTVKDKDSNKVNVTKNDFTIKENKTNINFTYQDDSINITSKLPNGNHNLSITYLGNANYKNSTKNIILSIFGDYAIESASSINVDQKGKFELPLNVTNGVDVEEVTVDKLTVEVSYKNGTKTEKFNVSDITYSNSKLMGTLENISSYNISSYTMNVTYTGTNVSATKKVTLKKVRLINITAENNSNYYQDGNFTFKVIDYYTGEAIADKTIKITGYFNGTQVYWDLKKPGESSTSITINSVKSIKTDKNGIATLENFNFYPGILWTTGDVYPRAGIYNLTIVASGDLSCDVKTSIEVKKVTSKVSIENLNEYYGTSKRITIKVVNADTNKPLKGFPIYFKVKTSKGGEITYSDNNGKKSDVLGTNTNGTILLPVDKLIAGTYTVYASLNDTDNYDGKSVTKNITIKEIPIKYDITAGTMYYNTGNTATIKVTSKLNDKPVEGAIVIVQFDNDKNQVYGYISDAKGVVNVMVPLNVGKHSMRVMDANDGRFTVSPVTKNINVKKATAKISAPKVSAYYKQGKYLTIKLVNTKNNKPIYYAKLNAKVYVTSKKYYNYNNVVTGSNGKVKLLIDLKPGKYKVVIKGADSKNFAAKKITTKITVKKAPTKITAKKLTAKKGAKKYFKVTVKNKKTKKPIAGIKVKIKVYTGKKFKTYKVKTNKKGIAQLSVKSLKVGKHKVVVTSANKYCVAKAAKSTIKIKK